MITELAPQAFHRVRHLIDDCRNVEGRAVISGMNPGKIYVDDGEHPTAALIWMEGQGDFQAVGNDRSEAFLRGLDVYMRTVLEPELLSRGIYGVEIIPANEGWSDLIRAVFDQRQLFHEIQHVYTLRDITRVPELLSHGRATIVRLGEEALHPGRYENVEFLKKQILQFWSSLDAFLTHGFGYVAEAGGVAASICYSSFVDGVVHAVGIETEPLYRRQGLGAGVASAFISECTARGLRPHWDCSPENIGSVRIAESAGLVLEEQYPIFWYNLAKPKGKI